MEPDSSDLEDEDANMKQKILSLDEDELMKLTLQALQVILTKNPTSIIFTLINKFIDTRFPHLKRSKLVGIGSDLETAIANDAEYNEDIEMHDKGTKEDDKALANCQSLNDLDDGLKKIREHVPELPSFNTTNLPKVQDVEKIMREKCKKQGADDAVEEIKDQQEAARDCVEQYVDFSIVQEELEVAKETGSMDEVFGKYCKKWPEIYGCLDNVTSIARQCMDHDEKVAFNKSLDILSELQEFVCFKDGDRLAMFVAEGGIECAQDRKDGIQQCINSTLGTRLPSTNNLSLTTLPTLLYTSKDCEDFETIRQCVNRELEQCEDSTPANIVDAFFKFLKKHLPCNFELEKPLVKQADVAAVSAGVSIMPMSLFVLLVVTTFGLTF